MRSLRTSTSGSETRTTDAAAWETGQAIVSAVEGAWLSAPLDDGVVYISNTLAVGMKNPDTLQLVSEFCPSAHLSAGRCDPDGDREILTLRHLEQLKFTECAAVMSVSVTAAKKRYLRALEHLHTTLDRESR